MLEIDGKFKVGDGQPLCVIAGPCVIESEDICYNVASHLVDVCGKMGLNYIFKASYDKANRSCMSSFRGPGKTSGLRVLEAVKYKYDCPVTSDVHEYDQLYEAQQVLDMIQIPALLSRQTDLLCGAAKMGKPVNLKKGQFMSPHDVFNALGKLEVSHCKGAMITERGTTFGYNNLVVDMRSLVELQRYDAAVCFDATHAVQYPASKGICSGGDVKYIRPLAKAACMVGIDAIFLETHPDPKHAKCDGANSIPLDQIEELLQELCFVHELSNQLRK